MNWLWIVLPIVAVLVLGGLVLAIGRPLTRLRRRRVAQALRLFRLQREQLEAKFFDLAKSSGKPRGLRWLDCEWHNDVTFARDLNSGLLTAFVAVNIRFEAIEGGDMEDVEHVSTVRDAAAVFHYRRGRWGTGGRPLFNMNPRDALDRLQGQFEPVTPAP
ncbi:MAG: hypothetical protein KY476_25205 [Planctomycetes bacterium]|nr:hypothetical protein [Planctomycetota bacterium]